MDLRQLTYLVAVADEGGIRAAARRLGLSQPPVSHALQGLEHELGVPLLRRSARGIALTAAGEELVRHARSILADIGDARAAVHRVAEGEALRVGLVAGAASAGELLAPIAEAFKQACPDLEVRFAEISFADQVGPLLRDEIDVAIVRGPLERGPLADRRLRVTPIAEEPRVLMVGADHELAGEQRITVREATPFEMLPLASPEAWSAFWQLDEERGGPHLATHVAPARAVPEVQLAVATQRVVITTPGAVVRLQSHPLVRCVELEDAPPAVIAVAARRGDTRRGVRRFVDTAQTAATEHIALLPGAKVVA